MNQKITTLLILVIFSLILFNSANAVKVYLRPPKMIIRLNTSDSIENSLVIENLNNITMGINATMEGDISDIITIENPSFEILANESETINFVTNAKNPGVYSGQIIVTYIINGTPLPYQLSSDITVIASKSQNPNIDIPITPILVVIIILIIVAFIIWFKRGRG